MKPQECVLGGLRWAFCLRDREPVQSGSCARAGGVLAILLLVPLAVLAADGGAPKKVDPAFEQITDDPKLPRVLLMG